MPRTGGSEQPDFRTLVGALAGTFPARDDVPLALTLLRLLAAGAPVSTEALVHECGAPAERVEQQLAGWVNVERDENGRVVAFTGLSLRPTAHAFAVGGRTLFTWCAWDTLFLPELLQRAVRVDSTCHATGQPVSMTVTPQAVLNMRPAEAVVSLVVPKSTDDIRATFCCNVNFFASADVGQSWMARHPGGALLTVDQAHELGRRSNERFFTHAQHATGGAPT